MKPKITHLSDQPAPESWQPRESTWRFWDHAQIPDHILAMFDQVKDSEWPLDVVVTDVCIRRGLRVVIPFNPPASHDWDLSDPKRLKHLEECGIDMQLLRLDMAHTLPLELRQRFDHEAESGNFVVTGSTTRMHDPQNTRPWEVAEYRGVLGWIPASELQGRHPSRVGALEQVLVSRVARCQIELSVGARRKQVWQRQLSLLKPGDIVMGYCPSVRDRGTHFTIHTGLQSFEAMVPKQFATIDFSQGDGWDFKVREVHHADRHNLKLVLEPLPPPPSDEEVEQRR